MVSHRRRQFVCSVAMAAAAVRSRWSTVQHISYPFTLVHMCVCHDASPNPGGVSGPSCSISRGPTVTGLGRSA